MGQVQGAHELSLKARGGSPPAVQVAGLDGTRVRLVPGGLRRLWASQAQGRGWRALVAPALVAAGALGVLVYDHLQRKVPGGVFLLAIRLGACLVVRLVQTIR